jgi:hypothetical protein
LFIQSLIGAGEQRRRDRDAEGFRRFQMLWGRGDEIASIGRLLTERWLHRRRCQPCRWSPPMRKPNEQKPLDDLSHSLTPFEPNQTLIAVIDNASS